MDGQKRDDGWMDIWNVKSIDKKNRGLISSLIKVDYLMDLWKDRWMKEWMEGEMMDGWIYE